MSGSPFYLKGTEAQGLGFAQCQVLVRGRASVPTQGPIYLSCLLAMRREGPALWERGEAELQSEEVSSSADKTLGHQDSCYLSGCLSSPCGPGDPVQTDSLLFPLCLFIHADNTFLQIRQGSQNLPLRSLAGHLSESPSAFRYLTHHQTLEC